MILLALSWATEDEKEQDGARKIEMFESKATQLMWRLSLHK